jgi:hypothetical protein
MRMADADLGTPYRERRGDHLAGSGRHHGAIAHPHQGHQVAAPPGPEQSRFCDCPPGDQERAHLGSRRRPDRAMNGWQGVDGEPQRGPKNPSSRP